MESHQSTAGFVASKNYLEADTGLVEYAPTQSKNYGMETFLTVQSTSRFNLRNQPF